MTSSIEFSIGIGPHINVDRLQYDLSTVISEGNKIHIVLLGLVKQIPFSMVGRI